MPAAAKFGRLSLWFPLINLSVAPKAGTNVIIYFIWERSSSAVTICITISALDQIVWVPKLTKTAPIFHGDSYNKEPEAETRTVITVNLVYEPILVQGIIGLVCSGATAMSRNSGIREQRRKQQKSKNNKGCENFSGKIFQYPKFTLNFEIIYQPVESQSGKPGEAQRVFDLYCGALAKHRK